MQGISEQQIATLATRLAARATLFTTLGHELSAPRTPATGMHLHRTALTSDSAYRLLANAAANWLTQMTASSATARQQAVTPKLGGTQGLPLGALLQALREVFTTDNQRHAIDQAHDRLSQQLPVVLERIAALHGLPASSEPIAAWLLPLLHRRTLRNKARARRNTGGDSQAADGERAAANPESADDDTLDVDAGNEALLDVVSWLAQAAYADEYSVRRATRSASGAGTHLNEYA